MRYVTNIRGKRDVVNKTRLEDGKKDLLSLKTKMVNFEQNKV